MIKIKRAECPECLNKQEKEFVESDYSNPQVIRDLSDMQHGKCCYCEQRLGDIGRTERWVDHYIPQTSFRDRGENIQWHLANKWENLLYSCATCNRAKGIQHPINITTGQLEIIDPSSEDINPEDHIDFYIEGHCISFREKEGSPLGRSTIDRLKLCIRTDLIGKFIMIKAEVEFCFAKLMVALLQNETLAVEQRKNELSRFMSANYAFAAFRRNYIAKGLEELNEIQIPKLEEQYDRTFDRIEIRFPKGFETIT